jgi:phosphoglycolate phosphatase
MSGEARCVVLFDLDGTLVESADGSPSAGLLAMNGAARRLTGLAELGDAHEFAGRTDVQIARLLYAAAGVTAPGPDAIDALLRLYLEELERFIPSRPYGVLGDPRGAADALRASGAIVGLGTGNLPRGAALKLASAGIADAFDLALGGYGNDGDARSEVLAVGARRCDPGGTLPVVIVGDTPRDVEAALAIGAPCVGVPFKDNTAEVLRRAGAEVVVPQVDRELTLAINEILGLF